MASAEYGQCGRVFPRGRGHIGCEMGVLSRQIPGTPHTTETTMPATKKTASPRKQAAADAVELLMQDHRQVKDLFKDYEKLAKDEDSAEEDKEALAAQICALLTVHTTLEEEIFYPAAREALEEQDLLDEAAVEHASAKDLIGQIETMGPADELYDAKVTVLGEYVNHHVQEEEKEMFPRCKKAKMPLDELGEQLQARKQELMVQMGLAEGAEAAAPEKS
jgi:hemerythrin superfamily protein